MADSGKRGGTRIFGAFRMLIYNYLAKRGWPMHVITSRLAEIAG